MDHIFSEQILQDDHVELSQPELQDYVNLDKNMFASSSTSVELTSEEQALITEMKTIAESKDPEFDKDPPAMGSDDIKPLILDEPGDFTSLLALAGVGVVVILIGAIVYKKVFNKTVTKRDLRNQRKGQNKKKTN